VLAPPRSSKAELRLKLCTNDGTIAERTVPRRERAAHARLRRLWWGDAIAETHSGSQGPDPESGSNGGPTAGSGSGRPGQ
jgi:ribosomal protein RSM22 (predicted rRNA methylase)